jgi:hypothetical protein
MTSYNSYVVWHSNPCESDSQVTFQWHCDAPLGPVCFHNPAFTFTMLPWDLSAFTNLLSLLQCSLGTWLSPVPLGLEGLSPVPFELEELSPFPLQGYPWRRGPRVSLPEDTGRVVGEGTLVDVSNVGLNKNRNKTQKMKRHDFYFVFY